MEWVSLFPQASTAEQIPVKEFSPEPVRPTFLIQTDDTLKLLCGSSSLPAAILDARDFSDPAIWRFIFAVYPCSMVDAARWWGTFHREKPPGGIMQAFGLAEHHRSLADWKELSELGDSSSSLHRRYELPLNTLRLWNRLGSDEQNAWMHIFELRQIKKNLVREIIGEYYDLSPETRKQCLNLCSEFAVDWQARSSVFPAQELRDIVHNLRYPQFVQMRSDVFKLKKELEPPKNIKVQIPDDLESGCIQLQVDLSRIADIKTLQSWISDPQRQTLLESLIKKI